MTYQFNSPPGDAASLPIFLVQELNKIQTAINGVTRLVPFHVAPLKPRDGDLVLALAPWNPGSGDGFYGYRAGSWRFLG